MYFIYMNLNSFLASKTCNADYLFFFFSLINSSFSSIVSCDGAVMSFWVFELYVGTEPLSAPHSAHMATLQLSGRPHTHTG